MTFNETGHGMYISKEFEIQRVTIDMRPPQEEDDEIDGSSIHVYPLTYVPHSAPMIPKSASRNILKSKVSKSGSPNLSDRNEWCEWCNITITVELPIKGYFQYLQKCTSIYGTNTLFQRRIASYQKWQCPQFTLKFHCI